MRAFRRFSNQEMIIRRDNEGIPNDWVIPFRISGGSGFKPKMRMNARGHYKVGIKMRKEKMNLHI